MGAARAVGLLLGVAADAAFGDPRRCHPVAAFGRLAVTAERACYAENRLAGLVYTAALVGAVSAVGGLAERAGRGRTPVQVAGTALATWIVLLPSWILTSPGFILARHWRMMDVLSRISAIRTR